jgi:7-carboxy-7-deazaguanine synthase
MKINEIFYSIQGEGVYMGLPMVFIRVTGCNLRCNWCDTKYAYDSGQEMAIEEIINRLLEYHTRNVCLTGGEPLAQDETYPIMTKLVEKGYTIYLETNGSINLRNLPHIDNIKISMDVKCPSSGEENKMDFSNFELLRPGDQVKFIIADQRDYEYAKGIINEHFLQSPCEIILTPCAQELDENRIENSPPPWDLRNIAEQVLEDQMDVRVLPQLQKILWLEKTRGV